MSFLASKKVKVLANWPPHSPDLNPVENLWACLKEEVNSKGLTKAGELELAAKKAWRRLTSDPAYVRSLFESMPNRLREVVRLRGGRTKY